MDPHYPFVKSLEIRDAIIATQNSNRDIIKGNVYIEGSDIRYVGKEQHDADDIMDGSHKLVIPGLINTHTHVAMTHLRGKLDDVPLSKFLELTFKLDSERTSEGIYNSSLLGIYEMIDSGVTSFSDLYYSEDIIARASRDAGIRSFLSWVTLDEDKTTQKGNPLKNATKFISDFRDDELVTPSVGVQGVYVAGEEVYLKAREIAEKNDTMVHGHLAETREEVYNFMREHHGVRPTEYLDSIGFLNPRFLAAHGVWNTLHEVRLIGKSGSSISWNPVSNAKLGVGGLAPIPEYTEAGVNITIGSDSCGSNNNQEILQSMKFGAIWVKNERWNPAITKAQDILDMATVNAAKAMRRTDLGSIEPGKKADLSVFDLRTPEMMLTTQENAVSNIVYSATISSISDVIINGKVVKKDGRILGYEPTNFEGKAFV